MKKENKTVVKGKKEISLDDVYLHYTYSRKHFAEEPTCIIDGTEMIKNRDGSIKFTFDNFITFSGGSENIKLKDFLKEVAKLYEEKENLVGKILEFQTYVEGFEFN